MGFGACGGRIVTVLVGGGGGGGDGGIVTVVEGLGRGSSGRLLERPMDSSAATAALEAEVRGLIGESGGGEGWWRWIMRFLVGVRGGSDGRCGVGFVGGGGCAAAGGLTPRDIPFPGPFDIVELPPLPIFEDPVPWVTLEPPIRLLSVFPFTTTTL